ncbi:hypothetical protein BVG01_25040 [Bacillus anthracis]|nr:hypothetical protein BVG01_25040 [Bacillus anthracis]
MELVKFNGCKLSHTPFTHVRIEEVFSNDIAEKLLIWLENYENWKDDTDSLNKSLSSQLTVNEIPQYLKNVFSGDILAKLKTKLESIFEVRFEENIYISVTKRTVGHGTKIHTDYIQPENRDKYYFTHRFLIYLNNGWDKKDGGMLGIFESYDANSIVNTIEPLHNSGFGFVISPNSYHAVGAVSDGERYNLLISLRENETV